MLDSFGDRVPDGENFIVDYVSECMASVNNPKISAKEL